MYPGLFLIAVFILLWIALGPLWAVVITLVLALLFGGFTTYDRRRF